MPVYAEVGPGPTIRVDFSLALTPGALDWGNWWARLAGGAMGWTTAVAAGASVNLSNFVPLGPNPGPDVVNYTPPPFDVRTPAGGLADLFTNFPVSTP